MHILKKDGEEKYIGETYNACLVVLQGLTPCSWDHAMKYEGWTITPWSGDLTHDDIKGK